MPNELVTLLQEVEDESLDECMELSLDLIESQLAPFGRTYGDDELSRGERIARVVDMAQRGVMDILETISPPTYDMLLRDYLADLRALELR